MGKYETRISRRDLLKTGALAGAGVLLAKAGTNQAMAAKPVPPPASPPMTPFLNALIYPIPKLTAGTNNEYVGADYYEINMSVGSHKFHSQLLGSASTFRYGAMPYLGPTIEAQKGKRVVVKFINNLPPLETSHPLASSIDPTVPDPLMYMAPDGSRLPGGRAVPHLHGGFTHPDYDGHPHAWFTPATAVTLGSRGSHYGSIGSPAANEAILEYSNDQYAANLWYHDHAMGITRLNVYAGLAGLYFIRDQYDTGQPFVVGTTPLPALNLPAGAYEVPLVVQDKQFNANGTLFYPTMGITAVHPIWMPEFFGDTPVVNAVAYPFFNVEPRRYRFRIVNGSQARFYNFSLKGPGNIPFWLIGMEQSLLPAPVQLNTLLLAPGERADVIIDFTGRAGVTYTLKNNAKAPYPAGAATMPDIMQFRVNQGLNGTDTSALPATLVLPAVPRLAVTTAAPMREIVMKEDVDPLTGLPTDMKLNGKWFDDPIVDETPIVGTSEIWQFINLTVDAHPMHMHLVQFQVYNRQKFDAKRYTAAWLAWNAPPLGVPPGPKPVLANFLVGPAVFPPPEEMGWKDTAKSYPGEILRVIAKFDLPLGVSPPVEYVYHCHILEHEENEMMRPFKVMPLVAKRAVEEETASTKPAEFGLDQNYPNPFNPETTIRFHLPADTNVQLKVFNNAGQEVATLADGPFAAGSHSLKFNANNLASGVYFAKIQAGSFNAMQKMLLMK